MAVVTWCLHTLSHKWRQQVYKCYYWTFMVNSGLILLPGKLAGLLVHVHHSYQNENTWYNYAASVMRQLTQDVCILLTNQVCTWRPSQVLRLAVWIAPDSQNHSKQTRPFSSVCERTVPVVQFRLHTASTWPKNVTVLLQLLHRQCHSVTHELN